MDHMELVNMLEGEYLQEYRSIQQHLAKTIRESSYLNVQLHDIANQLYTAQLQGEAASSIYDGDEEGFLQAIIKDMPEPLLKQTKKKSNRRVIVVLIILLLVISTYAISRSFALEDQRRAMGYLQESSSFRTTQEDVKKKISFTLNLENIGNNIDKELYADEDGNTIIVSDVEEDAHSYIVYVEACGSFDTKGGTIVSIVAHDIGKKHKAYELEGKVTADYAMGKTELPWVYLGISKSKNSDEYGFRIDKDQVAGQKKVKLHVDNLVKTTWTRR